VTGVEHKVGSTFPLSFYVWAALPLFAAMLLVVDWRRGWRFRAAAGVAAVFLVLFGAGQINAHYSYLPTIGDALGGPLPDEAPLRVLTAASERTGVPVAVDSQPTLRQHAALLTLRPDPVRSHFAARSGYIWLPAAYFASSRPELPVVMLLAGVPGDPSNLIRSGAALAAAHRYAAQHDGVAPILVFPDHNGGLFSDTECVDGSRGRAETYLTEDVPRYVEATFHLPSRPWGIIGYSEGGTCALTLALRHPDAFRAFVDIAGDAHPNAAHGANEPRVTVQRLYRGDAAAFAAHDPLELMRRPGAAAVNGRLVVGDDDLQPRKVAGTLSSAATSHHLPVTLDVEPGGHNFAFVRMAMPSALGWVADTLRSTPD
jgi:S-formylglutathione hydrolase FrmB